MGPLTSDQTQRAKPTKAQNEFIKNLERLTERSSWEVGEGSGSQAEKVPKLSPITGELGRDFPRADRCVEEVLSCNLLAGPQHSEGSDPYGSAEKHLMVFPSSSELGGVFLRSDGDGDEVGVVGGLPTGHKSNGAEVGCLGDTVIVAYSAAEDFPNSDAVLKYNGQSVNAESNASPSLLVFEFSDMIRHHKLLGKNCFSPISELGFDSKDDEILLLDWVNPKGLGKDEESGNALDCVPLAKWDPHGGLDIVLEAALNDFPVGEDLEPSVWVKRKIKGFSKYVGFPIDSCEQQCIDLFQKLEKVWEKQATAGSLRRNISSTKKGMRELRNLVSSVNYEGQSSLQTKGIENFCGVGSVSCP